MHITHQQEALSRAFVSAVAAAAGFKAISGGEPDDDSVDLILGATGAIGRIRSPKVEVQLKCKLGEPPSEDFGFDLKLKNYNDLGGPFAEYQAPRILVVVFAPEQVDRWARQTGEALLLRHRAYWTCMHDAPPTTNTTAVRVTMRASNVFTAKALQAMMDRVASSVSFGAVRPATTPVVRARFDPESVPVLREAARVLKEREPIPDFELEGLVVGLTSEEPDRGGTITVLGPVDGRLRRVRVELGHEEYEHAMRAHKEKRVVSVEGDLKRGRGALELEASRRLRLGAVYEE